MDNTMLSSLKTYFGILDSSKDDILNLIISQNEDLCTSLRIDSSLMLPMCVEDYSNWLKSGSSAFKTSQASEGVNRYSEGLRVMIKLSMRGRVF